MRTADNDIGSGPGMDVATALTRQMELHSTVRRPPKTSTQLVSLRDTMHSFVSFVESLKSLSATLHSDAITVFQAFMLMGVGGGGAVNFDRQHQSGAVPMHQAKVIAREGAAALEPALRASLSDEELASSVELCKSIRNTLRVKVEDGNDLIMAEKSITEAVEYLDFIYQCSEMDPERMFAFYMVEDERSLRKLLGLGIVLDDASASGPLAAQPEAAVSEVCVEMAPESPTALLRSLKELCGVASNAGAAATARIEAARTMERWNRIDISDDVFSSPLGAELMLIEASAVIVLLAEKRSTLCMIGCDLLRALLHRLSATRTLEGELEEPTTGSGTIGGALESWAKVLATRTFVTVAAISVPCDLVSRELIACTRGHVGVTKTFLGAIESGTQAELRRKCLGYLCLCVAASAACVTRSPSAVVPRLLDKLEHTASKYMEVGDANTRRMARALYIVLSRVVERDDLPGLPPIVNKPRLEKTILEEQAALSFCLSDVPALERHLFGNNCGTAYTSDTSTTAITAVGSVPIVAQHETNPKVTQRKGKQRLLAEAPLNVARPTKAAGKDTVISLKRNRAHEAEDNTLILATHEEKTEADSSSSVPRGSAVSLLAAATSRRRAQSTGDAEPKLCSSLRKKIQEARQMDLGDTL